VEKAEAFAKYVSPSSSSRWLAIILIYIVVYWWVACAAAVLRNARVPTRNYTSRARSSGTPRRVRAVRYISYTLCLNKTEPLFQRQ